MSTRVGGRVGQEVIEVVLTKLPPDQGWDINEVEISGVAAGGALCDGQGDHAVDVDVDAGAAGKVEPEPKGRVLVSVEDAAKEVMQGGGGGVCDGPDDPDLRRSV